MIKIKEAQEIGDKSILPLIIFSLFFYLLALSIPEMMPSSPSGTFLQKITVLVFASAIFGVSILTMYFFVSEYVEEYGEELLFNVLFASGSITFAVLFVFQQIIDKAGLYFISTWVPVIGYFVIAVILALALHRYWTLPYVPRNIEEAARTGIDDVFEDVFVR